MPTEIDICHDLPEPTRTNGDRTLTPKLLAFARHYARYRNGTQAYRDAFDSRAEGKVAASAGSRLLRDERVQKEIRRVTAAAAKEADADAAWLLRRFLDIATADPRELIGLRVGACRYCHGEGHRYQWREREYLDALDKADYDAASLPGYLGSAVKYPDPAGGLDYDATAEPHPDCPECHGEGMERFVPRDTDKLSDQALLLYGGVKVKKDGYEIIIADRQKALENAGRILGAFTDGLKLSGAVGVLAAVGDLRNVDPQEAAKVYREMIAGHLAT